MALFPAVSFALPQPGRRNVQPRASIAGAALFRGSRGERAHRFRRMTAQDRLRDRTVPVKQRSNKQLLSFQRVAEKTRAADHCQSNNCQAKARHFSPGGIRTACEQGLRKARLGACALTRTKPRPFLQTSKAANASQAQFQSSNSQANNRFIFSALRRNRAPRIIASQTTVRQWRGRFFPGVARTSRGRACGKPPRRLRPDPHEAKAVPPGVQGGKRFPSAVPVKQQSSKQSVYFQRVAEKTRAADHCQSNNRQAMARAFLSRRRPDLPRAGLAESPPWRLRSDPYEAKAVPPGVQGDERFWTAVPVKKIIGLLPACCGENACRGSLPVKQPSGSEGLSLPAVPGPRRSRLPVDRPAHASSSA